MVKKIIEKAVNLLCAITILISLAAAVVLFTTPKGQAPNLFGYSFMCVLTGSMEPALPTGTLIVVKKTDLSQVEQGDIISFYTTIAGYENAINTHRVTAVELDGGGAAVLRTKGDANQLEDTQPVTEAQLVGRVVASSLLLGRAVSALQKPYVFLPVVIIPLILLIVSSILHISALAKEELRAAQAELEEEYKRKSK